MRYDPENPMILHSCNGVLLHFRKQRQICVFNPITGETMSVNPLVKFDIDDEVTLALAVDLDAQTTFQFKLVVAEKLFPSKEETMWRFTAFVPSGGTSWLKKSPVEFMCLGEQYIFDRFVYTHGCMYYADEYNHRIIVFDVKKENARSIDWPQYDTQDGFLFGSLDGSLQCIYELQDEIEIHSYDQVKDVWQLKHKITNISSPWVLFCNGQRLLVVDHRPPGLINGLGIVHRMHDISGDMWEEISLEDLSIKNYGSVTYFSFMPTLAKVSDKYLHDPDFEFAKVYLRGLQRHIMKETGEAEEET